MGSGPSKGGSYKLTYFNGRGRGETARLCFAAAGVNFVDNRLEQSEWPAYKPKTPLGFLPVLEVNGKELTQQMVVNVFLATQLGLDGSNPIERAKIFEVMVTACDFSVDITTAMLTKDESKLKSLASDKAMLFLNYLQKTLTSNQSKSGFLVGSKLSIADLAVFNALETLGNASQTLVEEKFPDLHKLVQKIGAIPNIGKYLANRPKTPF